MLIKTSELLDKPLDWAVAKAEQPVYSDKALVRAVRGDDNGIGLELDPFNPSTNWAQGRPIIERERLSVSPYQDEGWICVHPTDRWHGNKSGPTYLIAALRCYVASKLGDEVEIPDELVTSIKTKELK